MIHQVQHVPMGYQGWMTVADDVGQADMILLANLK
jgi:hypothetical protein